MPKTVTPIYFYPRSPYGERPAPSEAPTTQAGISIHALLTESDMTSTHPQREDSHFYPRSPYGERRTRSQPSKPKDLISIHALLTESDVGSSWFSTSSGIFLSTLSLRRATLNRTSPLTSRTDFYPRSPYGERRISDILNNVINYFYPRSPYGERPTT